MLMNATAWFAPAVSRTAPTWRELKRGGTALLRMYAGVFLSSSPAVGALLLLATGLVPASGFLGLIAVASAVLTARLIGLSSETAPSTTFAYNALFLGLGASHTFAFPAAALALATLGAAACVIATAALSSWLSPLGLPVLSLPFVLVYFCAISFGSAVGAAWAEPLPTGGSLAAHWLAPLSLFLEALGALLFTARWDVGFVVLASLCVRGGQALPLAAFAFAITLLCCAALAPEASGLAFSAAINGIFSAIVLGTGWYAPSLRSYVRAGFGVLLSLLCTVALAAPLGRLGFTPASLPFNFSILAALLISRQRAATSQLAKE
jgi:urea transporter